MNSIGKWYLWVNDTSAQSRFWDGESWTTDAKKAVFFDDLEGATFAVASKANASTKCAVVISRATRNVFDLNPI